MRECGSLVIATVISGGLFGLQAVAQDADTVTVDVARCVTLEPAEARIACFGAQVDAALGATGSAEPVGAPVVIEDGEADRRPSGVAEPPRERERRAERATPPRDTDESPESEADEAEYFGTIVALRERLPNAYVITLDNGQVWQQVEPKKYPLRPGLEVRISPTRWGESYRLSGVGSGGHIQVRRVQ